MARRDDGGLAFARPASEFTENGTLPDGNRAVPEQEGMTLRQWYVGKVLSNGSLFDLADNMARGEPSYDETDDAGNYVVPAAAVAERLARAALLVADAAIAAEKASRL
jgi:hypothetical protein